MLRVMTEARVYRVLDHAQRTRAAPAARLTSFTGGEDPVSLDAMTFSRKASAAALVTSSLGETTAATP